MCGYSAAAANAWGGGGEPGPEERGEGVGGIFVLVGGGGDGGGFGAFVMGFVVGVFMPFFRAAMFSPAALSVAEFEPVWVFMFWSCSIPLPILL